MPSGTNQPPGWPVRSSVEERLIYLETLLPVIDKKLDDILGQTTKTNGRVDSLESTRDQASGAKWAFGIVFGVLGTIVGWVVAHILKP